MCGAIVNLIKDGDHLTCSGQQCGLSVSTCSPETGSFPRPAPPTWYLPLRLILAERETRPRLLYHDRATFSSAPA